MHNYFAFSITNSKFRQSFTYSNKGGNMIIEIILVVSSLIILNKWMVNSIKKSKDNIEKIVGVITIIISNIFLIIYYIDRFNLPTRLKINTNVDTQNWLMIITTCIASIISAAIGGLIAFGVARDQIKENNKQNSENLRIQNMPMLKYEIKTEGSKDEKIDIEHLIISNCEDTSSRPYDLFISIKNIGLNNVKRIFVDFESGMVNGKYRILGKKSLISIEKNETQQIYRYFDLESGKEYKMKLKVYYEDVLQNWYCQIVDINYNATTISNGSYPLGNVEYKVNEEILLDDKEVPKEL